MQATDWVIFGGTGDLSLRKLMPALYRCEEEGRMTDGSRVIATSRGNLTREEFLAQVKAGLQKFLAAGEFDEPTWQAFAGRLTIVNVDLSDIATWTDLAEMLKAVDSVPVYYLAIPPSLFGGVCAALSSLGLVYLPLSRPLASGDQAVMLMSSLRHRGKCSRSIPRSTRLYSSCRLENRVQPRRAAVVLHCAATQAGASDRPM